MPCKGLRLPGYDYTQPGAYFVTFCTYRRTLLFRRSRGRRDAPEPFWGDCLGNVA